MAAATALQYNFKTLPPVPSSKDFIDMVLSKTQRKTPTVIHARYAMKNIREFYMRKIKFAQQTFHDRLTQILEGFPKLDDIHPFYADLINVLYDRDHYKLALGQLNVSRTIIDNLAKDYVRLVKYGDSLYRCKSLKRAALGRMCTLMKKHQASLAYLEEVRQHLARLPSIDPNTRTLILTGFPNVGKSSFINKVSHANVDVQPYPFTTKSLFIGHMDYKDLRWQVMDTPGILDHSLEERNTIEMQAITALAHINCCVLFFIDISGQCGYTIPQQISLYKSIRPLFVNKPVVIVANKIDVIKFDNIDSEDRAALDVLTKEKNVSMVACSNISEEGIFNVKSTACDKLLEHRVATKLSSKKVDEINNRIHITFPKARDHKDRPALIPLSVLQRQQAEEDGMDTEDSKRITEKELEARYGGAGVYNPDLRVKHFVLADDSWKTDIVPEIMDGKNIADFVDPDIDARLAELEAEEDELQRQAEEAAAMGDDKDFELEDEQEEVLEEIRQKKKEIKNQADSKKTRTKVVVPRSKRTDMTLEKFEKHLESMGVDSTQIRERARSRSRVRGGSDDDEAMDDDSAASSKSVLGKRRTRSKSTRREPSVAVAAAAAETEARARSKSRAVSSSRAPSADGLRNVRQKVAVTKLANKIQAKTFGLHGRLGESDRFIGTKMPKHLFSGKRGIGTTDRR